MATPIRIKGLERTVSPSYRHRLPVPSAQQPRWEIDTRDGSRYPVRPPSSFDPQRFDLAGDHLIRNPGSIPRENTARIKDALREATEALKIQLRWDELEQKPTTAVVLGSGLGRFVDGLRSVDASVNFADIPFLVGSSVPGHEARFVVGNSQSGTPMLVSQGRIHGYEGYDLGTVTLPIRMMHALGIKTVILTNAAGSVNLGFHAGDFMLIADHLKLQKDSPLSGLHDDETLGKRFVPLGNVYETAVYDHLKSYLNSRDTERFVMRNMLVRVIDRFVPARRKHDLLIKLGLTDTPLRLRRGVYAGLDGPNYETPAEIEMLRRNGADAVGMSTVAEATVAKQLGMRVYGLSLITNLGSGTVRGAEIDHGHVKEMGAKRALILIDLLFELIRWDKANTPD